MNPEDSELGSLSLPALLGAALGQPGLALQSHGLLGQALGTTFCNSMPWLPSSWGNSTIDKTETEHTLCYEELLLSRDICAYTQMRTKKQEVLLKQGRSL